MSHIGETADHGPARARRHASQVPLRWADMDLYGHVNNVGYLRYLQEARVDMLYVHGARQGAPGLARGVVINKLEIDYLGSMRYSARPLRVETWVRELRNASFTLGYELVDADADAEPRPAYARASTVVVPYNFQTGGPRRLGSEEKAFLATYLDADGERPRAGTSGWQTRDGTVKTHVYQCPVRFDDVDAYGHVNNVMYAEYLQEARADFAEQYLFRLLAAHEGAVVADLSIDYIAPVAPRPDPLQVHVWVTEIGGSSFELAYEVIDDERTYVRAITRLVAFDLNAQQSRPLGQGERAALEQFLEVRS